MGRRVVAQLGPARCHLEGRAGYLPARRRTGDRGPQVLAVALQEVEEEQRGPEGGAGRRQGPAEHQPGERAEGEAGEGVGDGRGSRADEDVGVVPVPDQVRVVRAAGPHAQQDQHGRAEREQDGRDGELGGQPARRGDRLGPGQARGAVLQFASDERAARPGGHREDQPGQAGGDQGDAGGVGLVRGDRVDRGAGRQPVGGRNGAGAVAALGLVRERGQPEEEGGRGEHGQPPPDERGAVQPQHRPQQALGAGPGRTGRAYGRGGDRGHTAAPVRRLSSQNAASTASVAMARTMPVSTSWRRQKWSVGW